MLQFMNSYYVFWKPIKKSISLYLENCNILSFYATWIVQIYSGITCLIENSITPHLDKPFGNLSDLCSPDTWYYFLFSSFQRWNRCIVKLGTQLEKEICSWNCNEVFIAFQSSPNLISHLYYDSFIRHLFKRFAGTLLCGRFYMVIFIPHIVKTNILPKNYQWKFLLI